MFFALFFNLKKKSKSVKNAVFENQNLSTSNMKTNNITDTEAIEAIKNAQPNPQYFIRRGRGYVDWKFSEVCMYLGYAATLEYIASMHRWHDFEQKYKECLLQTTYLRYIEMCAQ